MFRLPGGDSLSTYYGREVGRFDGEEIYGSNGRYLGEVMNDNRLITSGSEKSWGRGSFGPRRSGSYARYANYAGCAMYAGYEDQLHHLGSPHARAHGQSFALNDFSASAGCGGTISVL
jgi:hypothetical protein